MKANCLTDKENMELRNKFCPEGSKLRESQMELFKMLLVLADICKEHKIQWWLSSGTLLGAARHQGFIPWDDDVDIVMMKEDYKRLEKVLMEMQSDEYVLQSLKTDVEYINVFAKFRKKTGQDLSIDRRRNFYRWNGVFVDIFTIEKNNYTVTRLSKVIYHNIQHLTSYIQVKWLRRVLIRFIQILHATQFFDIVKESFYSLMAYWYSTDFLKYFRLILWLTIIIPNLKRKSENST